MITKEATLIIAAIGTIGLYYGWVHKFFKFTFFALGCLVLAGGAIALYQVEAVHNFGEPYVQKASQNAKPAKKLAQQLYILEPDPTRLQRFWVWLKSTGLWCREKAKEGIAYVGVRIADRLVDIIIMAIPVMIIFVIYKIRKRSSK